MSRQITPSNKITLTDIQANAGHGGKLIFTDYQGQQAALLIRDNRLKAIQFLPEQQSKVGAVYIGKVKKAVRNLDAYFVEIGAKTREICFLSKKDAAYPFLLNRAYDGRILEGDEFPVQVIKDAQKTKQPSVTTLISLSNDYFAISVGETRTGYSNKFSPEEKKRLMKLMEDPKWSLLPLKLPLQPDGSEKKLPVGMVVRTQAANPEDTQALYDRFEQLSGRFFHLFESALHRTCFSCLEAPKAPWQAVFEQLAYPYEYDEILTDNALIYNCMLASDMLPGDKSLRLYDELQSEQLPLSKLYGLESKIQGALDRRVWLKSGGYLVIDQTEALTAIDVNSGKYEAGKGTEEAFFRINMEAAEEIAIQLRLRNLSGIIIVDFINMKEKAHQDKLLNAMRHFVNSDRQKTAIVDMTPLGLVEITRKKGAKTLSEQIKQQERKPYHGTGIKAF
ncbi:MAG: ribonuclease E/G [Lachnospiraceae bacterium]|nr:ribonuclease E/G [Lachnospiraceae bacterium]